MGQGIAGKTYVEAIIASIPNLAGWLLNDDSVPVNIHLYANDIVPDPTQNVAQFVAPLFTGYAPKDFPLVGQDPVIVNEPGTGNTLIKLGAGVIFKPTSTAGLPEDIYGWYCNIDGSSAVVIAGRFTNAPIVLTTDQDYIEIEPSVRIMLEGINSVDQGNE